MRMLFPVLFMVAITIFSQEKYNMIENNNVAKSAEAVCPLKISSLIPGAVIQTIDGKEVDLQQIVKGQKSILIFYRGGWCPYCNLQLSELREIEDPLLNLGYKIIAISMDNPEHLKSTDEKYQMKYELYSDSKAHASKAFGIAFTVGDEYVNKLKRYNMDLEASSGETHHILPVPAVFIIDAAGKIVFEYVNPDYKERISGKLLMEAAKIYNK